MSVSRADRKLEITLLQEKNAGTFARVYMARARAPGGLTRIVAVKVLRQKWADTQEILARTRDEAQLLARLQHPNILRVEAITEIEGKPALVMEFVHGADLGQLLTSLKERNDRFPPRAVYAVLECVLSALAAAYFKVPVGAEEPLRVVHRDIKPSNIMISVEGALKVLDFGTARFEDVERQAHTEAIRFGSLKYMSPERREGDRGDHASDIYGVGLLMLELILGETLPTPPIEEADHDAFVQKTVASVPDFGLPNTAWDASLVLTITRMLAYEPQARLDAQQCIPLFRQFKDQAIGDSLTAFAEQVVAPLSSTLNSEQETETADGSHFSLTEEGESTRSLDPEEALAELRDSTDIGSPHALLTGSTDRPAAPAGDVPSPVIVYPSEPRPGYAVHDLDTEDLPFDDMTEPGPAPVAIPIAQAGRAPTTSPTTAPAAPPTRVATAKPASTIVPALVYATIGCVVVSVVLGALSLAAFWFAKSAQPPEIASTDPAPTFDSAFEDLTQAIATDASGTSEISVELQAGDPTVQWIRLFNDKGDRLLTARPDASAQLSPGTYELRVKVVARSALSGEVSLEEDTFLSCKPATMGRVRCTDRDGNERLVIRP
jgi:serine/threonine protein kinase